MSTISRRAFLKTVGVGALSVAAMSVLAGCNNVPGTTDTVVTGAIEGTVDTAYVVGNMMTVEVDSTSNATVFTNNWAKAYASAVKNYVYDGSSSKVTSATIYESLTSGMQADVKAVAEKAAGMAKADTATVKVDITMLDAEADTVVLAQSGKANAYNSSYFTATANGAALKCTIKQMVLSYGSDGENEVECNIELPNNCKSFDLTVALPGVKAVKYTFDNDAENAGYLDTDLTKDDVYSYTTA